MQKTVDSVADAITFVSINFVDRWSSAKISLNFSDFAGAPPSPDASISGWSRNLSSSNMVLLHAISKGRPVPSSVGAGSFNIQ